MAEEETATACLKDELASGVMIENIEVVRGMEKTKGICGGDARIGASRIPCGRWSGCAASARMTPAFWRRIGA